jgi:hypothetical protein
VSNGRSHRRRQDRLRTALADAGAKAPVVIFRSGRGDGSQVQPIAVGKALFLVAVPPAGASAELLLAYSIRATATVTGSCPKCGARTHYRTGHVHRGRMPHDPDCPAGDERLSELRRREAAA